MDRDPGEQRRASLRASDADREQFVEALRRHHTDGRLTIEELTERTGRAYAAKTLGDLDALATDLPPLGPPAQPASGSRPESRPPAAGPPPRMRPPGPKRPAAKAILLRSGLWYGSLSVFLVVVWAVSGSDSFWPVWPILGFLLLLAWQAIGVYSWAGRRDDDPNRPPDR
jgi:Domain of unknown function (DUF1707)